MKKRKVTIFLAGSTIEVPEGMVLLNIIMESGFYIRSDCDSHGAYGHFKVAEEGDKSMGVPNI